MKLTDRIHLVASGSLGTDMTDAYDCNAYLIDGGSEAALIDAGGGRDVASILQTIENDGVPLDRLRYLFLTHGHADHAGGAAELQARLGLRVFASQDVARFLREGDEEGIGLDIARDAGIYPQHYQFQACLVDEELEDGDRVAVGDNELLVIETPGHAAGHLSFIVGKDKKQALFGGDTVFYGGRIVLQNIPDCDLQAYIKTIQRLSSLSIDVLLPGHLCFSLQGGQRHIDAAMEVLRTLGVPPNLA